MLNPLQLGELLVTLHRIYSAKARKREAQSRFRPTDSFIIK